MVKIKRYIHYIDKEVYALYYRREKTLIYNLDFQGVTHLIIIVF